MDTPRPITHPTMHSTMHATLRFIIWACLCCVVGYLGGACSGQSPRKQLMGYTMGRIAYQITYQGTELDQAPVDSLLSQLNAHFSTYDPQSTISQFNRQDSICFQDSLWLPLLRLCTSLHNETHGAFDPTLGKLIDFWGFGAGEAQYDRMDSTLWGKAVDTLRQSTGIHLLQYDAIGMRKKQHLLALELSAIAKGYAVDVLALFLQQQQITEFLLDIGGELTVYSATTPPTSWTVGIQHPLRQAENNAIAVVKITQGSVATSGNYRNNHLIQGKRYGHTLSPYTGLVAPTDLLSATLWVHDQPYPTARADALATACMVLGSTAAMQLIDSLPNTEAVFILQVPQQTPPSVGGDLDNTLYIYASKGIRPYLTTHLSVRAFQ